MASQADGGKAEDKAPERIPVTVAQDILGDLLSRVMYGREEFVLTKHGKDAARLTPVGVVEL